MKKTPKIENNSDKSSGRKIPQGRKICSKILVEKMVEKRSVGFSSAWKVEIIESSNVWRKKIFPDFIVIILQWKLLRETDNINCIDNNKQKNLFYVKRMILDC